MPELPSWLASSEAYEPVADRDGYIARSLLSLASALRCLRFDDGHSAPYAPSACFKLLAGFVLIVLNSLSTNFVFTATLAALLLARAALFKIDLLQRALSVALSATVISFLLMLPALLLRQAHTPLLIAGKTFVSSLLVMEVSLTTSAGELTRALRRFHVPAVAVLTLELTLKSINSLGTVSLKVLEALRLRSVGKNPRKSESVGAVGGVVLLKAKDAADATYDAMRCRGFDGEYSAHEGTRVFRSSDVAWAVALAPLVTLFFYLESVM